MVLLHPKDADRMTNNVDPDQNSLEGLVWPESTSLIRVFTVWPALSVQIFRGILFSLKDSNESGFHATLFHFHREFWETIAKLFILNTIRPILTLDQNKSWIYGPLYQSFRKCLQSSGRTTQVKKSQNFDLPFLEYFVRLYGFWPTFLGYFVRL